MCRRKTRLVSGARECSAGAEENTVCGEAPVGGFFRKSDALREGRRQANDGVLLAMPLGFTTLPTGGRLLFDHGAGRLDGDTPAAHGWRRVDGQVIAAPRLSAREVAVFWVIVANEKRAGCRRMVVERMLSGMFELASKSTENSVRARMLMWLVVNDWLQIQLVFARHLDALGNLLRDDRRVRLPCWQTCSLRQ